jgi:pyruvate,water dikinase
MSGSSPFPDPHEVKPPDGAEDWRELYPYYWTFSEGHEEHEDSCVWIFDNLHHPLPLLPIDLVGHAWYGYGATALSCSAENAIPTALGPHSRILNGYVYITAREITDPVRVQKRATEFQKRSKVIIDNWPEIWRRWITECKNLAMRIEQIKWPELQELEDFESVGPHVRLTGRNSELSSGLKLIMEWHKYVQLLYEVWHVHFEHIMLAFATYAIFSDFCKKVFPGIEDKDIAAMLAGTEQDLLEGDRRLRILAKMAVDLGIKEVFERSDNPDSVFAELMKNPAGRRWLEEWNNNREWFHVTTGNALYHFHTQWLDDLTVPLQFIKSYIEKIERGENIIVDRVEIAREALKLANEYSRLIPREEDRKAFWELLNAARTMAPALEGHAYYNDHWLFSTLYKKLFELGHYLYKKGVFTDPTDIKYLHLFEIEGVLNDLVCAHYSDAPVKFKREVIEKRRRIYEALRNWTPPLILVGRKAKLPEKITDPFFVGLWGLTIEKVRELLRPPEKVVELKGWPASPGVVEGVARVVSDPSAQYHEIQPGEILVTGFLHASQAPVFTKVKALVTDGGGVMSHPAIVARELMIPAVVGAGIATKVIKTGQKIRVDGGKGVVTILDAT